MHYCYEPSARLAARQHIISMPLVVCHTVVGGRSEALTSHSAQCSQIGRYAPSQTESKSCATRRALAKKSWPIVLD